MTTQDDNSQKKKKTRHVPLDIRKAIVHHAKRGRTPVEIYDYLGRQPEFKDRMPSQRSVQRVVKDTLPHDTSEAWSLAQDEGPDTGLILETLAAAMEGSEGLIRHLTSAQANWIKRVRRAVPDLRPWVAYQVAVDFQKCAETKQDTSDLDAFLAFAPWRSAEHERRYDDARQKGYVPPAAHDVVLLQLELLRAWAKETGIMEGEDQDNG
ncbi:MAG: hypothetical protein HYX94_01055 [Chloroflexi bacterium]|nr:hypothetical protein [Chloroflexota bacterium]